MLQNLIKIIKNKTES